MIRNARPTFSICLGLTALVALLLAPSAPAATVHVLDKKIALPQEPNMVAVDKATGSIYVSNWFGGSAGDIRKYNAAGEPENFSALGTSVLDTACSFSCRQIAVDNSGGPNQGVIYVSTTFTGTSAQIESYLPSGTQIGSIRTRSIPSTTAFCGVSVDDGGAVYTTHSSFTATSTYTDKFEPLDWAANPAQEPAPTATISPLDTSNPCRTAVDSSSNLAIKTGTTSGTASASIYRYPSSSFGPPEAPFTPGVGTLLTEDARDVSVNLADDNIYVSKPNEIQRYSPTGTPVESFGSTDGLTSGQGVAVNPTNGTVYVADSAIQRLFIFKEFDAAVPTLNPAGEVLQFTAAVSGEIDPDGAGEVTDCQFEYVDSVTFSSSGFEAAQKEPCDQSVPFASPQAVTAEITGLTAEKTYYFRLAATNANGTNFTGPLTFTTHAVQDLLTQPATDVGPREAMLHGSFTGVGEDTDYYFQYGESTSYDQATDVENAGVTNEHTEVETELTGLELETTYHYRIVASNSSGTTFGSDMEFTTPPAVAGVDTLPATDISLNGITLHGEFEGNGAPTSYYFEYGPTTEYGLLSEPAPGTDAGSPVGPTPVASIIDEFEGYKPYHYRLVAVNSFGETRGPDLTFETPVALVPEVENPGVSHLTPTSATLTAEVNPNRWPTVYLFEWGETTEYGSETVISSAIGGLNNLNIPVSTVANGLSPATTYHFRVVATNFTGTTDGPDYTFSTPDSPKIESSAAPSVGQTTARLEAQVVANSSPTMVHFEYGTTGAYGSWTAPQSIGSDTFARVAGADLSGLSPGTTYHYRVVAVNGIGTTYGPDRVMTTQPASAESPRSCNGLRQRAKRNSNRAKRVRRRASRATSNRRARALKRKASRFAKRARQLRKRAAACKRASGGSA